MCRVTIFEDESLIQMLWEDIVDSLDYTLAGSWASEEACFDAASTQDFDVAVLDVNLEGVISHRVLAVLEERKIPFLVCSGSNDKDLPDSFRRQTMLQKPFSVVAARQILEDRCKPLAA